MKILYVNTSLDPVWGGGTGERTLQLCRYTVKKGYDCALLITDLGLTDGRRRELSGVKVTALPTISKRFFLPRFSLAPLRALVEQADVIHLMGHWSILNAVIYYLARQANKPYVVCPAGALPIFGRSRLFKRAYNIIVGKKIIRHASRLVAITVDEIKDFTAYGAPRSAVTVIPNGIDPENYRFNNNQSFRDKFGLGNKPFILFLGRLNLIKGPDLLLRAFGALKNELADYQLVLAGPDEGLRPELLRIAEESGVKERVCFTGYLGLELKSQALQAAEFLAISSRSEAMSIVVLEAGAAGRPVLLTDCCGFNQVSETRGGIVVAASVEGLSDGLLQMAAAKRDLGAMGQNLQKMVFDRFTWDAIIKQYLALFNEILAERGKVGNARSI